MWCSLSVSYTYWENWNVPVTYVSELYLLGESESSCDVGQWVILTGRIWEFLWRRSANEPYRTGTGPERHRTSSSRRPYQAPGRWSPQDSQTLQQNLIAFINRSGTGHSSRIMTFNLGSKFKVISYLLIIWVLGMFISTLLRKCSIT